MNDRLRVNVLEAVVSGLSRCARFLSSNPSLARTMRAVERRQYFEKIYLHEQMLGDRVRLDAYHAAIERYVTPQDIVLDAGTGTGILAFLAAAKSPRKIYAIDHSKKMLSFARSAAAANGIAGISFMACASHRFRPAEPIDVIIQEQMGIGLFDEGMVDTIIDLRERCLKPGGRILPAKFEFYLEPVQLVERERVPLIEEQRIQGLRFPPPPAPGSDYRFREVAPADVEFLLCDPEPVFAFDLGTLTRDRMPKAFTVRKTIRRPGELSGICAYFKATFDDDISFSTGPAAARTHWPMLLYRTASRRYEPGQIFDMRIEVPELSEYLGWSWRIGGQEGAD